MGLLGVKLKVSRDTLVDKLIHCGLGNAVLQQRCSWLTNPSQRARAESRLCLEVPRGMAKEASVPGRELLSIFINDLGGAEERFITVADDTKLGGRAIATKAGARCKRTVIGWNAGLKPRRCNSAEISVQSCI